MTSFSSADEESAILKVGEKIKAFQTTDQHGRAVQVKAGPRYALFSFEMGVAKNANRQFEALGSEFLPGKRAVFVANIYGMPKIGRVFAMPRMRKYPHQIILADEKGLLDSFPQRKGFVTVLTLDAKGIISAVRFWNPQEEKVENYFK